MRKKVRVHPETGYAYIPDEARKHGFVGDVESIPNHFTWVWIKPGATLEQIKKSLQVLIEDIENQVSEEQVAEKA